MQRRTLSQTQFYQLCQFLQSNTPALTGGESTKIADMASAELAFSVAPQAVRRAAKVVGLPLRVHTPARDVTRLDALEARIELLEMQIGRLDAK